MRPSSVRKTWSPAKSQAIDMAVERSMRWSRERGDSGKIWASMLKESNQRRKPDFKASPTTASVLGNLLEEAQARGCSNSARDRSGAYVYPQRHNGAVERWPSSTVVAVAPEVRRQHRKQLKRAAARRPQGTRRPQAGGKESGKRLVQRAMWQRSTSGYY